MHELTPELINEVEALAVRYNVTQLQIVNELHGVLQHRVPDVSELDHYAQRVVSDRYLRQPMIDALDSMHRITAYHWAVATKSNMVDVLTWFEDHNWNAREFVKAFPITLPRSDDGLVDPSQFDLADALNLALVTDQQAHIFESTAAGAGDDAWFDYIPDAIQMLSALQAENWAEVVAFLINNPHVFSYAHPDPDDVIANTRQSITDKLGFVIMDDASGLLLAMMPEIDNDAMEADPDTNVYGPTPWS